VELNPDGFVPLAENILDDAVKLLIGTAIVAFGAFYPGAVMVSCDMVDYANAVRHSSLEMECATS
jgi:hypothetical protein